MRRDIQALRGLAVLAVVLYHLGGLGAQGGFLGVDIFFVISGYVITRKLSQTTGSLRVVLRDFYLRRIRRILPASALIIALTLLGSYLFLSPLSFHRIAMDGLASTLFIPNLLFLHQQTDYLNQGLDASPFLHYWSLGVEEQFYFIWPVIFYQLFKKKILPVFISLVLCAGLGIIWTSQNSVQSFYLPFTRFWEFMAGAGLIYILPAKSSRAIRIRGSVAIIGWILAIASVLLIDSTHDTPGLTTLIPIIATMAIIVGGREIKALTPFALLGDISFSLYLVHWPLIIFFANGKSSLSLVTRTLLLTLSMTIASALYYLYENPIRRSKRIAPRSLLILVSALLVGALSVGALQAASAHISTSGKSFSIDLSSPIIYTNGCHLPFGISSTQSPCLFGDLAAHRTIALVGDSHAAQWFTGLNQAAISHHWKLLTLTKSSCPPAIWAIIRAGKLDSSCVAWAKRVQSQLIKSKPELIILSSFTQYKYQVDPKIPVASVATFAGQSYEGRWSAALNDFIAPLKGSRVVILGDTPNPPTNSPACLAKNLTAPERCSFLYSRSKATTSTQLLAAALKLDYIDPVAWLCLSNKCPAVWAKKNAYRDSTHISVPTSVELSTLLAQALSL